MRAAATFSSRWSTREVPGMGSITGLFRSVQASTIWVGVRAVALGDRVDRPVRRARARQRPRRQRKPGDEADPLLGAVGEHVVALALGEVVAVLHRRHLEVLARPPRCS